jgi:crotonobetainyl-CoA:carnitine CoA-transferase CaiB-like acyl-CoA transferase
MMAAIGRTDLVGPDYANNHHRVAHQKEIEKAIMSWTRRHTPEEVCETMESAKVPYGKIMNVKDLVECEHLIARGMVEEVYVHAADQEGEKGGWTVKVPGIAPKLEGDWSRPTTAGPNLGQHNAEVLGSQLGLKEEDIRQLRLEGIVA